MTQKEEMAQFDPASFEHIPVLLNECLDGLNIDPAGTYLDGTAGGAGHSRQIALRLDGAKGGRLVSLDQDPDAVQTARARLAGLPATVVQINFRYAGQALESLGIEKINGALLDLGVSSHQLDDAARGFLEARQTIDELLNTINHYLGMSIDLGRAPTPEEIEEARQRAMSAQSSCSCGGQCDKENCDCDGKCDHDHKDGGCGCGNH